MGTFCVEYCRRTYIQTWHCINKLNAAFGTSPLFARHKAWFDVLYEKVGVRSGVIHPGKHMPASAGKIQLGNYGKFWEELVEGRVEYLHDGTRPTSRC